MHRWQRSRTGVQPVLTVLPMFCGTMGPRTCTELALKEWWADLQTNPHFHSHSTRHKRSSVRWLLFLTTLLFWVGLCSHHEWGREDICMIKTSCSFWVLWGENSFDEGIRSPCRSSKTRVLDRKLCPHWRKPPVLLLKGTNQASGLQSRFVFCYSNRRITRLHSICCWTASDRAPQCERVIFALC